MADYKWHPIDKKPDHPMMVELFRKNLRLLEWKDGQVVKDEPLPVNLLRDHRRSIDYWDGETFRDLDTGHEAFESWWMDEDMKPTHWRALPPLPE